MQRKSLIVLAVLVAAVGVLLVPTSGQAAGAPKLAWSPTTTASPATYDFGTVAAGSGPSQVFTLTNSGGTATSALTVSLGGTNASQFSISNNSCSATSLGPKKHCSVTVTYTETAQGASDTATLTAMSKKPAATARLTLAGSTTAPPPNLVPNPGFEDTCQGSVGSVPCHWAEHSNDVFISQVGSPARSGSAALSVTTVTGAVDNLADSDCFPISASTTYDISGWYYTNFNYVDPAIVVSQYSDTSCSQQVHADFQSSAGAAVGIWTQLGGSILTQPTAQSAKFSVGFGCSGCTAENVVFDDVSMTPAP
jgi:hypothetical protein